METIRTEIPKSIVENTIIETGNNIGRSAVEFLVKTGDNPPEPSNKI